jgi:tRNA-dihydrouridine synthase
MAELSHRALRELVEGFGGCDEYYTEMISAGALLGGGLFESWYIDSGPAPEKLVFQLVGADSGQICRAAALLDQRECLGIDINMGCSAPLIRKTGAGAAWMASIDRAGALIEQVRQVVKRRLSVKLRIGFTDDFEYLARFCQRLESAGTELIILHPRTAAEKFKRTARWDYVAALRKELQIPVAGNGDIASAEDLCRRAESPCDAVMVGRSAVRQPWIFAAARNWEDSHTEARKHGEKREISGLRPIIPFPYKKRIERAAQNQRAMIPCASAPPCEEMRIDLEETGLRFLELLARFQPPEFHLSRARRFFGFFCDNLKWGNYLKNLLNREESLPEIERVWREFFAEYQEEAIGVTRE